MKKSLLPLFLGMILMPLGFSQTFNSLADLTSVPLFAASPFQDSLWAFDTTDFHVVYRASPTPSSGGSITGINSITTHPCTGKLYIVVKQSAVTGRVLGIYDPATAVVNIIGNLGDNFSSITFREDGQLFGVTGDGANTPETLYQIDAATAVVTLATPLGNGADGEVIGYNKDDNFIYHWSGNGTVVFEKLLSASPYTVTNIPISGATNGETFGAVYTGNNTFIISNISSGFQRINTNGTWSAPTGFSAPDDVRGLALVNRWIIQNGEDTICANDSSLLTAMGGEAYQWTRNGTPVAGATSSTFYAHLSGMYNCLITTDTTNCTSSPADTAWFSKKLVVLNLPNVTINPSPIAYLCNPGDSILLTGSSGGTSQWYMNGAMIPGATTNTHYVNTVGSYNMVKTNLNGCSDSATVATQVANVPAWTFVPTGSSTLCNPASVLLTVNSGADAYQWLRNDTALAGQTNDSLTGTSTGNYACILTYGSCTDTAGNYQLTVIDCSGIDENTTLNINIYPNPADEQLYIQLSGSLVIHKLEIVDMTGRKVWSSTPNVSPAAITLSSLQAGVYLLNVTSGNTVVSKRFVKK